MVEAVLPDVDAAATLFIEESPAPLTTVDILAGGRDALVTANTALGLALVKMRSTIWLIALMSWAETQPM
jgi:phosphoribosylformylglycinamidine synthase